MADRFLAFDDLLAAAAARSFDRPPALVCNAHVTGLEVARSLADRGIPVVALDRVDTGVAHASDAVALAGRVTYPLDDEAGFRDDLEALAAALGSQPVAFGCMDEWVHALARTRPEGVRLPFAADRVDAVLDKVALYGVADDLGVAYPESYRLAETLPATDGGAATAADPDRAPRVRSADEAAEALGFPIVVKPALKRRFEEALGTNVLEVADREAYDDVVARARAAGVRAMAQARVDVEPGGDRSFVSYAPPTGEPFGVVGRPARYPEPFGTSCLVETVEGPDVEAAGRAVLEATGYHGISEAEFVTDAATGERVLLDVNTRPWKWIGLPVAAGADLPYAAYADAVGETYDPDPPRDATWVYLADYLRRLADGGDDRLSTAQWRALATGAFVDDPSLATAVYRPDDPGPALQLLETEVGGREYYCAC